MPVDDDNLEDDQDSKSDKSDAPSTSSGYDSGTMSAYFEGMILDCLSMHCLVLNTNSRKTNIAAINAWKNDQLSRVC